MHLVDVDFDRLGQFEGRSPNGFWENDSFRNHADYAMTEPFRVALERLRDLGRYRRCAEFAPNRVGGVAIGGSSPTIF